MKIGVIGCGNMGFALLKGIAAKAGLRKSNLWCFDKDKRKSRRRCSNLGVSVAGSNRELTQQCQVIILAVKPQDVEVVAEDIRAQMQGKLLISICAGITTTRLEQLFGRVAVVRVMPNMPAQIWQGISAISLGKYARAKDRTAACSIFSCVGEVVAVKERLLDAVTAISGSGPAYFFYLVEKLIAAAKELGIAEHIAQRLAIKTALGSAMLMNELKASPQILRKKVTSKGGTTQAAFRVLQQKGLDQILSSAVRAAARRSKELSS